MDLAPILTVLQALLEQIFSQFLPGLLAAALLLLAGRYLINGAVRLVTLAARRSGIKQAQIDLLKAATRAIGLILVLAGVLQALGLSQLALALGGTIGFVALGIASAASGNLGDIIAGVFLASDPDFGNGFRIKTGDVDGVIEQIDLRKTRIRAEDGKLYVIPNKEVESKVWIVQARPQQVSRPSEGGVGLFLRRTTRRGTTDPAQTPPVEPNVPSAPPAPPNMPE